MKKQDVAKSIEQLSGNMSAIARKHDKSRAWMYEYIRNNGLWDDVESSREKMIDNVESALYQQALAGNTTAMIFFLKTQGKKRGYVERSEITGADGKEVVIRVQYDDK